MHSKTELTDALAPFIVPGEHLMVHSSYKALNGVEGGPNTVIDVLMDLVGPAGTLLLPTFTLDDWAQGHYFDFHQTTGKTGIIGEMARRRSDFIRTPHPMYNFAVAGADWRLYAWCDDHDSFGSGSVFAAFHDRNGRILSIGVTDPDSTLSQAHYNEQAAGAEYRYVKKFSGIYVGKEGRPRLDTYSMFVRLTLRHRTRLNPGTDLLKEMGMIHTCEIFGAASLWTYSDVYFHAMVPLVQSNPELWHEVS